MFSNTENNSASDKVKTRPKLKAYLNFINLFKTHQQKIAIIIGYLLVAAIFFGVGRISEFSTAPAVRIEEPALDLSQIQYNPASQNSQPATTTGAVAGESFEESCQGKIKGNISSSGKIYHLPGGMFYDRTKPEICFDTEKQAQDVGFRKSQR